MQHVFLGFLFVFNLNMASVNQKTEQVTFGAGCFWCVEAIFQQLKGVISVQSGYSGGIKENPTYKEVCEGLTGHAEVCQITFDPQVISFSELLEAFWTVHDPTTLNKQGNDIGTQYRSVIFYHSEKQKQEAQWFKERLEKEKIWNNPIVTEIKPMGIFYTAEEYHQDYYFLNKESNSYCSMVITPKLEKFKKAFSQKLNTTR